MFLVCCAFIYPNASLNNSKQGAITLPLTSSPQLFVGEESKLEITSMSRTLVNSTLADVSFCSTMFLFLPPKKKICISYNKLTIYSINILKCLKKGAAYGGGIRWFYGFRSTFSSLASTPLAERTRFANFSRFLGQVSVSHRLK